MNPSEKSPPEYVPLAERIHPGKLEDGRHNTKSCDEAQMKYSESRLRGFRRRFFGTASTGPK